MMLTIENLHATVADKPFMNRLTFAANAGKAYAIMDPTGVGKSTFKIKRERS